MASLPLVKVVAAALVRDGQVLIAQRPPGKHMAGAWEFPGGKVVDGEPEADALARELLEELGVEVRAPLPVMVLSHEYPEKTVQLSFWLVESFGGEPEGLEGQALKWVPVAALPGADILPADRPFIDELIRLLQ